MLPLLLLSMLITLASPYQHGVCLSYTDCPSLNGSFGLGLWPLSRWYSNNQHMGLQRANVRFVRRALRRLLGP